MANSFQTANLALPTSGSIAISQALNFANATSIAVDLSNEQLLGKIDFIQSVFIDNADSTATLDLLFAGGPTVQRVRAQANSQGWYPVSWPRGEFRLTANSNSGLTINLIFANFAMPYIVWGPASGVTVVPPLVNTALLPLALAAGVPAQLVPAVAAQSVRLYRGIFNVDNPTILKFQDASGGNTLFSADLTAGGALTFQPSGIPWFNTSSGNGLYISSSANCNLYGGYGVTQS